MCFLLWDPGLWTPRATPNIDAPHGPHGTVTSKDRPTPRDSEQGYRVDISTIPDDTFRIGMRSVHARSLLVGLGARGNSNAQLIPPCSVPKETTGMCDTLNDPALAGTTRYPCSVRIRAVSTMEY